MSNEGKIQFIRTMLFHAQEALGAQHGWLIRWALAKAAQECGWDIDNALIIKASNCLGIKAEDATGKSIPDVPFVILSATTGPEAGRPIHWRVFPYGLTQCFGEFVRQLNDRIHWDGWRRAAVVQFENVYTDNLKGHAIEVLATLHDVTDIMYEDHLIDAKGRIKTA